MQKPTNQKDTFVRFLTRLVYPACFVPACVIASLFLRGDTYSPLCGAMVGVALLIVGAYVVMQSCHAVRTDAFWTRETGVGPWLRSLAAFAGAGLFAYGFYAKFLIFIFEPTDRAGRLAALYARVALPESLKRGLILAGLAVLFGLCALGLYAFFTVAYRREGASWPLRRKALAAQCAQAMCVLLALFFTLAFFGPLDIVFENSAYLVVHGEDLWLPLLTVTMAATLLLGALLGAMERGMFRLLLGMLFGLALAAYLQGTFFNPSFGTLDGTTVDWSGFGAEALTGAALWMSAICVQLPLSRRVGTYPKIAALLSLAIVGMQLTALLTVAPIGQGRGPRYVLDGAEEYTVSTKENVVVFTLDFVDNVLFDQVLEAYPQTREELGDFVYFDNTAQAYMITFPSMTYLLTGMEYDTSVPTRRYVENAWHGNTAEAFYSLLQARDYRVRFFMDANYAAINAVNMAGKADNVREAALTLTPALFWEIMRLSAYRYAPLCAKEAFWTTTETLNQLAQQALLETVPIALNDEFYLNLQARGLSASDAHNMFSWYHLVGAHIPYVVDETGGYAKEPTDAVRQTRGYLVAVIDYLQRMKARGVYDAATIVISADHGGHSAKQVALLVKRPFASAPTLETRHAPAAQSDIMPTILDCMGESYQAFGTSVFDLEENETRERVTRIFDYRDDYPQARWIGNVDQWEMAPTGGAIERYNVLLEYRYSGGLDELMRRMEREEYDAIIPLYDSFY